jgi:hypothetical protein
MVAVNSTMLALGTALPHFTLTDCRDGAPVASAVLAGQPVLIAVICNHCPFVVHIREVLARRLNQWQAAGVRVIAVASNDIQRYPQDGAEAMANEARVRGFAFPYCLDADQAVAKALRAACTPDFFLFDAAHRLAYRGRFDGASPGRPDPVTGNELAAAVEAVLAGQSAPAAQIGSLGCNIKWIPGQEPEWFPH